MSESNGNAEPPWARVYVGIRPKLEQMKAHHASTVFLYLLTRLDRRTGQCDPTTETIARDLDIDVRTVSAAKKALRALGVIGLIQRPGKRDNFTFPALDIRVNEGGAPDAPPTSHVGGTRDEGARDAGGASGAREGVHGMQGEGVHPVRAHKDEEEKTKKRNKKKSADEAPAEIPLLLNTPRFQQAWDEWLQHRKELGKKVTCTSARRSLTALERMGVDRAVAAIEHSISQGWTGIFEAKDQSRNGNGSKTHPKHGQSLPRGEEVATRYH